MKYPNTIRFQPVDMHYSFETLSDELSIRHLFGLHANRVMNPYVRNIHPKYIPLGYLFLMDANRVVNGYVSNIHSKGIRVSYLFVMDAILIANHYVCNISSRDIFLSFLFVMDGNRVANSYVCNIHSMKIPCIFNSQRHIQYSYRIRDSSECVRNEYCMHNYSRRRLHADRIMEELITHQKVFRTNSVYLQVGIELCSGIELCL
jgi:hypothetical protein